MVKQNSSTETASKAILLVAAYFVSSSVALADEQKSSKFLQGGVKDSASINSSVKMITGGAAKGGQPPQKPLNGAVQQFSGSAQTSGQPQQHLQGQVNDYGNSLKGVQALPGYGVQKAPPETEVRTITTTTPGKAWVEYHPGFNVYLAPRSAHSEEHSAPASKNGVTTYEPGLRTVAEPESEATQISTPDKRITVWTTGRGSGDLAHLRRIPSVDSTTYTATSKNGVVSWVPGYEISDLKSTLSNRTQSATSTCRGVMTYVPGYEVAFCTPPTSSMQTLVSSVHGVLATRPIPNTTVGAVAPHIGVDVIPGGEGVSVVPVTMEQPTALVAQAGLLPGLKATRVIPVGSWSDWYKRFTHSVYENWMRETIGPGDAKVRVIVYKNSTVECQVQDFIPAAGVDRDASAETIFRETALRDINNLSGSELMKFPILTSEQQVTFDLDMKRAVDGPVGCEVLSAKNP